MPVTVMKPPKGDIKKILVLIRWLSTLFIHSLLKSFCSICIEVCKKRDKSLWKMPENSGRVIKSEMLTSFQEIRGGNSERTNCWEAIYKTELSIINGCHPSTVEIYRSTRGIEASKSLIFFRRRVIYRSDQPLLPCHPSIIDREVNNKWRFHNIQISKSRNPERKKESCVNLSFTKESRNMRRKMRECDGSNSYK